MQTNIVPTCATWNFWYIVGLVLQWLLVCDRVLFKPVLCVIHFIYSVYYVLELIVVLVKKTVIRNVAVFKIWLINVKQNYICHFFLNVRLVFMVLLTLSTVFRCICIFPDCLLELFSPSVWTCVIWELNFSVHISLWHVQKPIQKLSYNSNL